MVIVQYSFTTFAAGKIAFWGASIGGSSVAGEQLSFPEKMIEEWLCFILFFYYPMRSLSANADK